MNLRLWLLEEILTTRWRNKKRYRKNNNDIIT